ncbi:DUF1127 domain-containing protein [Oricola sp.]|uniref:DUF1127 domain-containing protein n=1 Tax=Oricola sp. TaxID=1979950 RepID=UPI003BAC3C43
MADIIVLPRIARAIAHQTDTDSERPVSIAGLVRRWIDRAACRRMLREELLPQPDSVLNDAGITRQAAACEAAKPFWKA